MLRRLSPWRCAFEVALVLMMACCACREDRDRASPAPVRETVPGAPPLTNSRASTNTSDPQPAAAPEAVSTFRRVVIGEVSADIDRDFGLEVTGHGGGRVGRIAVSGLLGTLRVERRSSVLLIYARHRWTRHGYDVYQGLSYRADRFWLVWLYCAQGRLAHVYLQDAHHGELHDEPAQGRCSERPQTTRAPVRESAATVTLNTTTRYAIEGERIELSPTGGHAYVRVEPFDLLPFGEVDCLDCGPEPWHEIHAFLIGADDRACVGILYLGLAPGKILLSHVLCLPDLGDPTAPSGEQWFRATWRRP